MPNKLINEQSIYLLKHAHNPVNWYTWSQEAFEQAVLEDKPILVSIGYAACHWCHVMERESFENKDVAEYMNNNFINIKVDREERPDIDQIYMDAITAISGSGGWPLNCFLLPNGKPFYGGTYFPPVAYHNRPSWIQVLKSICTAYRTRKTEIEKQANELQYYIENQDKTVFLQNFTLDFEIETPFDDKLPNQIFWSMNKLFDAHNGGFGNAPKFPQTQTIEYLWQYYYHYKNNQALNQATLSCNALILGGIYDHLAGGFARYTTDSKWIVPHFEKMLYDNALIVQVLCSAYQNTYNIEYKQVIEQTLNFLCTELMQPNAGFYSSYDADSEGEEGKFYVWTYQQIQQLLGSNAPLFIDFFGISEQGNFEGKNILFRKHSYTQYAQQHQLNIKTLIKTINNCKKILLNYRNQTPKPDLDDKLILGWNALAITALAKAYKTLQIKTYKKLAINNLQFVLQAFKANNKTCQMYHTYKNGKAYHPAFLDDYAFLIEALLQVYTISCDEKWLQKAQLFANYVYQNFANNLTNSSLLFFTHQHQTDILYRKTEFYDNATPSGNSTMAQNWQQLAALTGNTQYNLRAIHALKNLENSLIKYPTSFSRWATLLLAYTQPFFEVVIVGEQALYYLQQLWQHYLPNAIIVATSKNSNLPLFINKWINNETWIYVCKNEQCYKPTQNINKVLQLLNENKDIADS